MADMWKQVAEKFSDREYLVSESRRATYHEVYRLSCIVAHGLQHDHGMQKGDRIAIVSRNTIEYVVLFWAANLLGCIVTGVNAFQKDEVIAACINLVGAKMVVMDSGAYKVLEPYLVALTKAQTIAGQRSYGRVQGLMVIASRDVEKPPSRRERTWLTHPRCRVDDWDDAVGRWTHHYPKRKAPSVSIRLQDTALILFTSGTTSLPKAVYSSNDQVISSVLAGVWYALREFVRLLGELPEGGLPSIRKTLCMVPLFHVMGLHSVLLSSTVTGDVVAFMHKYTPEKARELIKREQLTGLLGIGYMVKEIMTKSSDVDSITTFAAGGAAPPESLSKVPQDHQGILMGANGYGLTETNSGVVANMGLAYLQRPRSIGEPAPFLQVKICDASTGKELPRGTPGELWIRAPNVAMGYYNNPKATKEAFDEERFFHSGDLAVMDSDGFLWILDRIKDLIIRKGENISCITVESAVLQHASVKDCAAIGLRDEDVGERVAILCVVEPGSTVSAQAIVDLAATSLPRHAVPDYVWLRTVPLPRNATGKVLKTDLRLELEKHVEEEKKRGARVRWEPRSRL
ncbi:CoA-ligase [Malassezia pachydermatis]